MKDAFGAPSPCWSSAARPRSRWPRRAADRPPHPHGVARRTPVAGPGAGRRQLRALGADVHTVAFDALDPASHETVLGKVFAEGDIDLVLLAFGVLGDQARDERDRRPRSRRADQLHRRGVGVRSPRGPAGAGPRLARGALLGRGRARPPLQLHLRLEQGGAGRVRPGSRRRPARHRRARDGRPPGVRAYAMTAGREETPPPTTPEAVATAVEVGLRGAGDGVGAGPAAAVMSALRHVPRAVFRRLPI